MEKLALRLQEWNKVGFGNIFFRKRRVLTKLGGVQTALYRGGNPFLWNLEKELMAEYNTISKQEELFWFHKSCSDWILHGDREMRSSITLQF